MNARRCTSALALAGLLTAPASPAPAAWIWIEGEQPAVNRMNRHPWWYDQIKRDELSGGDFISNFSEEKEGVAEYQFNAPAAGAYEFWLHANPVKSKLSFALNEGPETAVNFDGEKRGEVNLAADGKPDLRFIAWVKAGKLTLQAGTNTLRFRMASELQHHGILDCLVLSTEPFIPRGLLKPDQMADDLKRLAADSQGWFPFEPGPDAFGESPLDLRFLNERFAGEHGFIGAKDGQFIHTADGQPVRFWAVNGPPHEVKDPAELRRVARLLAKRGVNLVRVHGGLFDATGRTDPAKVQHAIAVAEAMKAEGIYTHYSIYFPLWLKPKADGPWLAGYDGTKHPFAALFFNPAFQAQYRQWWEALLLTPSAQTGRKLVDEPAVFGLEMQNEDSFFFWTFDEKNLPDPQLRMLEKSFGDWLTKRYGSLDAAVARWNGIQLKRDEPAEGRIAFRPLWNMCNEKTPRDQDTAAFLLGLQTQFYADTRAFLRKLGFKGVVNASNWSTASPEVFGPLEKLSYLAGDFIDRHGYFECDHKGDNAAWSIRNGHTFADRSALRFDASQPGEPKQFVHPVMDPQYDDKPSMISETTFCRPNRFRSEAPLYYAAYGALQDSDCIVHFAFDGTRWEVKPNFWMQQWTLMSPAMLGQFPAAALIYRRGLVTPGRVLAEVQLDKTDLLALKGTPLPQDASLDELRLKDVPQGREVKPGQRLDPLLHYAGRAQVKFVSTPGAARVEDLRPLIDHAAQTVTSSTGELRLDYGKGLLRIESPRAQGLSGALKAAGPTELPGLSISSDLELGHILAVPLDDQPLATSSRILLQVMSEEKPSDFTTEPAEAGHQRIANIGRDPWLVRTLQGTVRFKRPDAAQLKVTALDINGYRAGSVGDAAEIRLQPRTMYYLISR
jgi:hypothetical protein